VLPPGTVVSSVSSTSSQSSTNVAAIVGGVVGGVGGIAVLIIAIFLCMRWRKRKELDDVFDGDFDPGRVTTAGGRPSGPSAPGTLPRINVPLEEDDGMGGRLAASDLGIRGTVQPYYEARPRYAPQPQAEMSEKARILAAQNTSYGFPQAGPSQTSRPQTGSSSDANYNAPYTPTVGSSSTGGYYTRVPMQQQQPPFSSPPGSDSASSSRGTKDRERTAVVSNPEENPEIVVHQDGGRVLEIPPSYDSIPADERV
jgi:hypothetical protein